MPYPTLSGRHVRLEPLSLDHLDDLADVGLDPEIWRWTLPNPTTRHDLHDYIESALRDRDRGSAIPFAIIDVASGRAVGSTRYGNVELEHRRVEIGWTWIAGPWQRTAINTEAKLLLLGHAFESLGCIRVELKTDVLNERSRRAIERIGATQEGILRRHMITPSGRVRDTVYYSIIEEEWPAVKARLLERLVG